MKRFKFSPRPYQPLAIVRSKIFRNKKCKFLKLFKFSPQRNSKEQAKFCSHVKALEKKAGKFYTQLRQMQGN